MNTISSQDAERAAGLRRMKLIALSLLVVAAVVYAVARAIGGTAMGYVAATAEAAMVGALADWFAVTALFRHPLGVPIPHTAIIPHRKDEIGRSLGEFVETEFMSSEVLGERLASIGVGRRLGEWLATPANATRAATVVGDVLRGAIEVIDDREVQDGIERIVEGRIRSIHVAPLLGRAIDVAVEGGHHERALDAVFTSLQGFLDENRDTFRERLQSESPWWVPEAIDNRVFAKIYDGVSRFLRDVGSDRDHEVRRSIEQRVVRFADRLRDDPELIAKGEHLKEELLAHPDVRAWMTSLWQEAKRGLIDATSRTDSELHARVAASLRKLGERLRDEPELQAKIDSWVSRAVTHVIENYRHEVSGLIETTVARWDADSTSRKIELQIGRDLQFIRINGTVVGGLAGLLIHAISEMLF